jgi:hypothetical protein
MPIGGHLANRHLDEDTFGQQTYGGQTFLRHTFYHHTFVKTNNTSFGRQFIGRQVYLDTLSTKVPIDQMVFPQTRGPPPPFVPLKSFVNVNGRSDLCREIG